nr:hypothetical protein [Streptococcus pneumoniae]
MIYDKIKEIASEKGISIYRIEKDLDLGNGAISKWNNSSPSATTLNSIARIYRRSGLSPKFGKKYRRATSY